MVAFPAFGAPESVNVAEYRIKAACLYNFLKFIEWPSQTFSNAQAGIVVGVIGQESVAQIVGDVLREKTIDKRPINVIRFGGPTRYEEAKRQCHVLFLASSTSSELPDALPRFTNASVLTIGESPAFCQNGGIINFRIEENKVRFDINASAAERVQIKISSKLLKLGTLDNTAAPPAPQNQRPATSSP
jgi:hypothetical protein